VIFLFKRALSLSSSEIFSLAGNEQSLSLAKYAFFLSRMLERMQQVKLRLASIIRMESSGRQDEKVLKKWGAATVSL
jgi:hypothetical protein